MHPIHDVDVLLLLATTLASKRRPAELVEIMAATDLIHGNIPSEAKLAEAFSRLASNGLLKEMEGGLTLTPAAQEVMTGLPKKGESDERLFHVRKKLDAYEARGSHAPIVFSEEALRAAIVAHRSNAASAPKNLLMPKPKPEGSKPRPGQRQRKPMPARKRKV